MLAALRAIWIGIVVGASNAAVAGCVVASQLESWEHDPAAQSAALPAGLLAGACLGLVAHVLRRANRAVRRVALAGLAIAVVYALANHYSMARFAFEASIPTIVAALVLEHCTYPRVARSAVPVARLC